MNEFTQKIAQEIKKRKAPPHTPATMEAFPDYSKSLTHQRHRDPAEAGRTRALGTGITGAALGALVARILSDRKGAVAGGALAGGALGAGIGYGSGKSEAESDYSKILFLRRRLGMNEPGEFEALQKHPALIEQMIDKKAMTKIALSPKALEVLKVLGVTGAAGAAGWGLGTEGTSRALGYHEDPGARHMGGAINAVNIATLAGLGFGMRKSPGAFSKMMQEHIALPGTMVGMELAPSAKQSLTEVAKAQQSQAQGQVAPSVARTLGGSTAQGAGAGAGLAGLAALITGMTRARSDKELGRDTSRTAMVGKDFAKYVLPAAAAGGVIGSLRKQ